MHLSLGLNMRSSELPYTHKDPVISLPEDLAMTETKLDELLVIQRTLHSLHSNCLRKPSFLFRRCNRHLCYPCSILGKRWTRSSRCPRIFPRNCWTTREPSSSWTTTTSTRLCSTTRSVSPAITAWTLGMWEPHVVRSRPATESFLPG